MPTMPGPSMSGSSHAPMPVPGCPGARPGVGECAIVLSKLDRMRFHAMDPGEQISPVARKRLATVGAQFHGLSAPQLHWYLRGAGEKGDGGRERERE